MVYLAKYCLREIINKIVIINIIVVVVVVIAIEIVRLFFCPGTMYLLAVYVHRRKEDTLTF